MVNLQRQGILVKINFLGKKNMGDPNFGNRTYLFMGTFVDNKAHTCFIIIHQSQVG